MFKQFRITGLIFIIAGILAQAAPDAVAQCPMCKANVIAAQKRGEKIGLGLNTGILFLLSMPYLVVGTIGVAWYLQNRRKKQKIVAS